jgi:signal transduction histidine kinase
MNIINQIRVSLVISLILAVVISGSIVVSYQNMQELTHQEDLAADVVRGGYELNYLTDDYLVNANPRARTQWEERYTSLQPIIILLKPHNMEEEHSIEAIKDYNAKIGQMFREIPEPGTLNPGAAIFPAGYQQVTWSRNSVQSQGLIFEAWRLRHLYGDEVNNARIWNNILVIGLILAMLVIISINYLLISRRLIRSINEVNAGSKEFAHGNLGYRIPVISNDEMGEVAAGLNSMAGQIASVTASRDDLNREIDERKRVEKARRESDARFVDLFETVTSGVAIYEVRNDGLSGKDYIVKDFNKTALALEGKNKEDVVGKSLFDLRPGIDEYGLIPIFREVWRTGNPAYYPATVYVDENYSNYYENRVFRLPGGEIVAVYNDVTGQKQAEEQLLFTNTILSSQAESTIDGILVVDDSGKIISYNKRFVGLWGIPPDVIAARSDELALQSVLDKLVDPDEFLSKVKYLYQHREDKSRDEISLRDGRFFDRYTAPMIGNDGVYYGRIWNFRDITEGKKAETAREFLVKELEQKNAELDRFAYTVSHDLKSPLITIQGFLGYLGQDLQKNDPEQVKGDLQRIAAAVEKMERLITTLLELSRSGKRVDTPEQIPFTRLVRGAAGLLDIPLKKRGVMLTVEEDLPVVSGDPERLLQVLTNLLENAVKFMGDQKVPVVDVGVRTEAAGPVFFVRDNGMGIRKEDQPKIFGLFERLHPGIPGTGIGLATVKRIIEAHGGKIWVESDGAGKGTTFWFTLPGVHSQGDDT